MHIELDIKKCLMILGDMSVAVRGRPPKSVERSNVVLRIPKDLLERIKAHQASLEALAGVSIARHDVMLVLLQKGLEACAPPAPLPSVSAVGTTDTVAGDHPSLPPSSQRRKDAISHETLEAIAATRKQHPDVSLRVFGKHLFTTGIYRAVGKDGEAKPASLSFLHRWLGEAREAGML
jgi:hypothetical protein